MDRTPVESSSVKSVGYADGVCELEFAAGTVYRSTDVTPAQFEALMASDSKGKHYAQHLRGLAWSKVDPEQHDQQ